MKPVYFNYDITRSALLKIAVALLVLITLFVIGKVLGYDTYEGMVDEPETDAEDSDDEGEAVDESFGLSDLNKKMSKMTDDKTDDDGNEDGTFIEGFHFKTSSDSHNHYN